MMDGRTPEERKEYMRHRAIFMRCKCGILYSLRSRFIITDEGEVGRHVCPACGAHVIESGALVPFDEGWCQKRETLLPEGVTRHGEGIHAYYTGLDEYSVTF